MVNWLTEPEQRAWRALQLMQGKLNAALARDLSLSCALSYQDYMVLVALTDTPGGRARLFELSVWLSWEKSRTSHHVSRMMQRGLVRKQTCPSDGRGAYVHITAQGRRELESAAPSHVEAVRRLCIDRLTPAQLQQLEDICVTVLSAIDQSSIDQSAIGPDGLCPSVAAEDSARARRPG